MEIRFAAPSDAPAVAAIYAHYVQHTAVTFATHTPTAAAYAARISDDRYPFLVAEEAGEVIGFVYAAAFREKEAYRWDVELTIYLAPGSYGAGIGRSLLTECLRLLREQGYLNAYSCITLPNERSIRLHERLGFRELGVFPKTGYKSGKWHDVVWMGLELGDLDRPPEEPKPWRRCSATCPPTADDRAP